MALPATGKQVTLTRLRIDRLPEGKIAEPWPVADLVGVIEQPQS